MSSYFSEDFNTFFKELAPNNHKDWFDENRSRYEQNIREPFKVFVSDLIDAIRKEDPAINIEPKDAIFRINRDIRFSKDKSPYKMHMAAAIGRGGKKHPGSVGIYFQLGPGGVMLAGGSYEPSKEELNAIRHGIAAHPNKFRKAIEDATFVKHFGEIKGDKNKVLPKDLKAAAEKEPLIYNKAFYYSSELDPEWVSNPGLFNKILDHYKAATPVKEFLEDAMKRI